LEEGALVEEDRLALDFALGVNGLGGVFSILARTASRELSGALDMADDPLEYIPGYISPLSDKEHARLGRIAVLWGQIEHFVEYLLPRVSGLTWKELEALQVTEKQMASKTSFLQLAAKRLGDAELEKQVRKFCELIHDTKTRRNHAFHGIWGLRANSRFKTVEACARRTVDPKAPMKVAQLIALERELCRCSRLGLDLLYAFEGDGVRVKYNRFLHHADREPPEWLKQWSKRNPLDCEALDRNAAKRQLPRPEKPFPRK
jgi:hypothetical protein